MAALRGARTFHEGVPREPEVTPVARSAWVGLTTREAGVAAMICGGDLTRTEIAHALDISPRTYDTHRGAVMRKLACRTEVALVRMALERGWTT